MSFKHIAVPVGDRHYVLPQVADMRVEIHAYLSAALYEASDEALWSQAAHAASYPGVTGVYLMPDTHLGFGVPVGCVVVTEDTILQAGSGYDISCGVLYLRVPGLGAARVREKKVRGDFLREVEKRVATGVGNGRPKHMPRFSSTKTEQVLRYGAKALGVRADVCERQYIPIPEDIDLDKIPRAHEVCAHQLGSVGGGNHFIEMQVDRDDGSVWVMIHCGSRGYGWQIAEPLLPRGRAPARPASAKPPRAVWLRTPTSRSASPTGRTTTPRRTSRSPTAM